MRTRVRAPQSVSLLKQRRAAVGEANEFLSLVQQLRQDGGLAPRLDRVHFVGYRAEEETAWDVNPRLEQVFMQQARDQVITPMEQARDRLSPEQRLSTLAPFVLTLPDTVEPHSNVFIFQLVVMEEFEVRCAFACVRVCAFIWMRVCVCVYV
jgi:hypothetical protein